MSKSLEGLRIQIVIEEDGSSNPPSLPEGTLIRSIIGPDRELYYLIRLDRPVKCRNIRTGGDWILQNLAIAPNFKGGTLDSIISTNGKSVPIGIANMFHLPLADDPVLDFSKGEYFATGSVRKA